MDNDIDDKDDTKRRTRNLSEKKRRDQFNMLVTELSTLITSNNRKMDKSTVLRSTISFLKNHNEVTVRSRAHDVQEDWKPAFLSNEEFTYLVLEALEGFVMVFSASGRICYVSESITSLLGHNSVDIVNKSIFDLTYEEDRPSLYNLLQSNAAALEQMPNLSKENEMIRFHIHLRRGTLDFREDTSYDLVQFCGHFRSNQEQVEDRDMMGFQQDHESRILFVCIGRLHTPQLIRDASLVDSSRSEFTSRHSLEWKFLFLDHRAPPIIGYLPFEVLGTSGYDYYHFDDLEKVVTCHEALMQKGELTSCYYRFLTKGQQWIWLQTRFYITYHQWNSKPEFVVCTHRVVSYEDLAKTTKQEGVKHDTDVSETEANHNNNMKDTPSEDQLPPMSPSYMSEAASDAYGNSYQPVSQRMGPPCNGPLLPLANLVIPEISILNYVQPPLSAQMLPQALTSPPVKVPRSAKVPFERTLPKSSSKPMLPAISQPNITQLAISPADAVLTGISPSRVSLPAISPSYASLPMVSPSYTAETATDEFGNSFQLVSKNTLKTPSPEAMCLSPSCMSERSDSFAGSFQPISQTYLKTSPSEGRLAVSPLSERSDSFVNSYPPFHGRDSYKLPASNNQPEYSQSIVSKQTFNYETEQKCINGPLYEKCINDPLYDHASSALLPIYQGAANEGYKNFQQYLQPASVKSASASSTAGTINTAATTGASWRAHTRYTADSDTTSQSGESLSSQRNSERESLKTSATSIAPQHGIGAQYLDPSGYDGALPAGMVPLSAMPVLMTPDQAQMQEQLQRKHEELQQMIVRQQEELRQVKEQLLLARLGILQPLINVPNPYSTPEEMQNQQRMTQLAYTNVGPRAPIAGYSHNVPLPLPALPSLPPHHLHQPHPPHPPHPPHQSHPPHTSEPHQHMPK